MKKTFLTLFLLLFCVSTAHAVLLFSDDFNSGANPAWGNELGDWSASGGVYDAASPNNNPLTYSSVTTFPSLTDFRVEVDVLGYNDGAIWLRSSDNNNGVLLVLGGFAGTHQGLYFHEVIGGTVSPVMSIGSIPNVQGTSGRAAAEVVGNTYKAYWNGSLISTFTTDKFPTGKVALFDNLNETSYDNFALYNFLPAADQRSSSVPEPATIALLASGLAGMAVRRRKR
ncbi:MAG: PEP-CTERM sorting domain-containing protein [Candidatus Omnitrophica bacterium]|nr:PEP-CTERM sorting domain-containing protein [Candidatus Omnitrophota bacterium]